jgi:hypothetical protein
MFTRAVCWPREAPGFRVGTCGGYAGLEKRTCEPCVPLIFTVTVLLPVPTFAGAGKSEGLFTTLAVCPFGTCTCKNGAPVEGVKST